MEAAQQAHSWLNLLQERENCSDIFGPARSLELHLQYFLLNKVPVCSVHPVALVALCCWGLGVCGSPLRAALHSLLSPGRVTSAWAHQLRSAGLSHSLPWLVLLSLDPVPGMASLITKYHPTSAVETWSFRTCFDEFRVTCVFDELLTS